MNEILASMGSQPRPVGALECPRCGRVDRIQAVPAVYAANRSTTQIRAEHYGSGFASRTRGSAVTMTMLGRQLAPPQASTLWAILVVTAIALGGFFAFLAFLAESSRSSTAVGSTRDFAPAMAAVCLLALGCGAVAAFGIWRLRIKAPMVRRARELWASGWYCGRCHGVFSATAAAQQLGLVPPAVFAGELAAVAASRVPTGR
jgi:hypothetical protein